MMSLIQIEITKPTKALIFYTKNSNIYAEHHRVLETDKGYILGPGTPLLKKSLSSISRVLKEDNSYNIFGSKIIPQKLLYADIANNYFIWQHISCKRNLYFSKTLNIKSGLKALPNLLFVLKSSSLYVYATKTKNISEKTILYQAPFHNVYNDGRICLGNAKSKIKGEDINSLINRYENLFFESEFSSILTDYKGVNLNLYWDKDVDKFDNKILNFIKWRKRKITIQDLINKNFI